MKNLFRGSLALLFVFPVIALAQERPEVDEMGVLKGLKKLGALSLPFDAKHPQGLVKVEDHFYLTSVDKVARQGLLIKFHLENNDVITDAVEVLKVSRAEEYHPGGIDFDPRSGKLITALAQYSAASTATLIAIDPESLKVEELKRVNDHIGGVFVEKGGERIWGVNWDAKDAYLLVDRNQNAEISPVAVPKASDKAYQDLKFLGAQGNFGLATGLRKEGWLKNGYLSVIAVDAGGKMSEVGTSLETPKVDKEGNPSPFGKPLAQNPLAVEVQKNSSGEKRIVFYFVPHDGVDAKLLIFQGLP